MSRRKILVADLLCGAGGSSTGCARAMQELGLEMELVCVNHWPVAIDTHRMNHPQARHYVQDIATVRPHLIVPEGYLDLLIASPTCTHHSVARGGKPTSDQQRSDPWHIITWLTELRVKRLIVENVWEFIGWGPVDHRTGKPVASRKGEYFYAWIETIRRLGFDPEWRKLNAADYGDATTRQRFILMARSDRKRVTWPMPTHTRKNDSLVLFPSVKPWRPAREIIDWSIKGRSILNRKKPLAPKTLARIYAGAQKFGWPEPFLVILRNHMAGQTIDQPLPTIAANGTHIGLAQIVELDATNGTHVALARPVVVNMKGRSTATDVDAPIPTQTSHAGHICVAEPFVIAPGSTGAPRETGDPLPTITTGGAGVNGRPGCARPMLIEPFVLSQASGGSPRSVGEPIPTATTGGKGASHALISPYYSSGSGSTCDSVDNPLPTVTPKARFGMVVPVTHSDGSNRARDLDEPLPTLTTAHRGEHALIEGTPTYDIHFRMLEPHELAAAMGFNDDETSYEFAGTKTEKIKLIGNAVSVSKMRACVLALMADARAKPVAVADDVIPGAASGPG